MNEKSSPKDDERHALKDASSEIVMTCNEVFLRLYSSNVCLFFFNITFWVVHNHHRRRRLLFDTSLINE